MVSAELRSDNGYRPRRSPTWRPRQRLARRVGLGEGRSVGDGLDSRRRTSTPDPDGPAGRRRGRRAARSAVPGPLRADRRPTAAQSPRRMESVLRGARRRGAVSPQGDERCLGSQHPPQLPLQHDADAERRRPASGLRRRPGKRLRHAQCSAVVASPSISLFRRSLRHGHVVHKIRQHGSLRHGQLVLPRPRTAQRIHVHRVILPRLRQDGVLSSAYRLSNN